MPSQHITEEETSQEAGIVVPLELDGLRMLRHEVQEDSKLRVEVMGTKKRERCPHCGTVCVKQHDVRPRRKRDIPLRGHAVELVLYKRRFWCITCHKSQGSEFDSVLVIDEAQALAGICDPRKWRYTAVTRAAERVVVAR